MKSFKFGTVKECVQVMFSVLMFLGTVLIVLTSFDLAAMEKQVAQSNYNAAIIVKIIQGGLDGVVKMNYARNYFHTKDPQFLKSSSYTNDDF